MSTLSLTETKNLLRAAIMEADQFLYSTQGSVMQRAAVLLSRKDAMKEMEYVLNVEDCFLEHYSCCSLPIDDALYVLDEYSFIQVERWLIKIGYDKDELKRWNQ